MHGDRYPDVVYAVVTERSRNCKFKACAKPIKQKIRVMIETNRVYSEGLRKRQVRERSVAVSSERSGVSLAGLTIPLSNSARTLEWAVCNTVAGGLCLSQLSLRLKP